MADSLLTRFKNGWNAFWNRDPTRYTSGDIGGYYRRPDRIQYSGSNERTMIASIYNRIALDAASIEIKHVLLDEEDRYLKTINSGLNNCLNLEANINQTGRAMRQDAFLSMLDEGCVAVVPVDTNIDPTESGGFDIRTLQVGKVTQWYSEDVKVRLFNNRKMDYQEVILPKSMVTIVENPFYVVMNGPNSTMQRLARKLSLLDAIDEQSGSGKLDLIIQLPYAIKHDTRRQQAETRRKDIEMQLSGSKYGIAYIDGTERITQLNRPLENNLLKQIEYLTSMLFSQLNITQSILDGTADEKTMLNYYSRTIEPIVSAFVDEMKRKFLTKTARTQKQSILFFRDPFKLVPVNSIAEIADKFTRNEIMTSNEIRQAIGLKPSSDPKADQLVNSNISQPAEATKQLLEQKQPSKEESDKSEKFEE